MFLRKENIQINEVDYIKEYFGYIDEQGEEIITTEHIYPDRSDIKPTPPEPTQLDRIEEAVNKSQQGIIDAYTLELIEMGVL